MKTEQIVLNPERNVTLTAYLQDVGGEFRYIARRPAVLILPGGGYAFVSDIEADPVAFPYLKAGYQAFVLRYSVGKNAAWPNPMEDYEQAMEMIREKAEEWKVYPDKIAVIGFSAGGHLAAAAATSAKNRPNAAILGYSVVGEDIKNILPSAPETISLVDAHTCPCFLFHARTDDTVNVMNTIRFTEALAAKGVAFESHVYGFGPHGFSTCDPSVQLPSSAMCERIPNWVQDSIGWLGDMFGHFCETGMSDPTCPALVSGDFGDFLSIDCTMGRILANPQGRAMWESMMAQVAQANARTSGSEDFQMAAGGDMMNMMQGMKMRTILSYVGLPDEMLESINAALQQIPNT